MSPSHVCFTVASSDHGDLWRAGWVPNPGEPPPGSVILGGTGKYAHARGVATFNDLSEAGDFSVTEHLFEIRR